MQIIDNKNSKLPPQVCGQCSMSALCMSFSLNAAEASQLDKIITARKVLHAGESLYQQNAPFRKLFAIRSGAFKCSIKHSDDVENITGFYFPGEILGLDAISNEQHLTSAVALETSSICEFAFVDLLKLSIAIPNLQQQLFKFMSRDIEKGLQINANSNADSRMAKFLINVSAKLQRQGYSATQLELSMSRQDIGSYLGLTPETISRLLTKFQAQQLLTYQKRTVTLTNLEQLRQLANSQLSCGA